MTARYGLLLASLALAGLYLLPFLRVDDGAVSTILGLGLSCTVGAVVLAVLAVLDARGRR